MRTRNGLDSQLLNAFETLKGRYGIDSAMTFEWLFGLMADMVEDRLLPVNITILTTSYQPDKILSENLALVLHKSPIPIHPLPPRFSPIPQFYTFPFKGRDGILTTILS